MPEVTVPMATTRVAPVRDALVRRARLLAWLGVGWHGIEAAVAVGAGIAAGSVALVGFGADSLVEAVAGVIVLWRFAAARADDANAERRAQRLIAVSFYVIAAYVGVEAVRSLAGGHHPDVSWVGIGLSAVTLATMPALANAKARVGEALGSSAAKSEGRQSMLCAYLSAGLLAGLGANALLGWWWADPAMAVAIAMVAVREGRESWRGESCCTAPVGLSAQDDCTDACCAGPMPSSEPIACTLSGSQMAERFAEVNALGADALRSTETTDTTARLRFSTADGVRARLEGIVAAESVCCAFMDFAMSDDGTSLTLDIRSPAVGAPVMHELVAAFSGNARPESCGGWDSNPQGLSANGV